MASNRSISLNNMWKSFLTGLAFSSTTLMVGISAQAQASIPVLAQCPEATWANGYHIGEVIALSESQYKPAVVSQDSSPVRSGAGYTSTVMFRLNPGERVTVTGEAWDINCNQWMQITLGGDSYWIHGDHLRLLSF